MEEEAGGKVTRLRRRLSVETEETKSPSAPSTPSKKRGGRLAAKPQLELIDENATDAVPKRTRKSTVKDIMEPVDEKPVTPSRRSTRIRSNTSILSETQSGETVDEKPMTPARRSARIRSNTSLVSETTQNINSPRAKRAARRNSQVGSDTESSSTPARQTRRTRKDSASSIDKAEVNTVKVGSPINEVIVEEVETHVKESNNNNPSNSDSHSLRKSPRLMEKIPKKSSTPDINNKENQPQSDKETSVVVHDKIKESIKQAEPVEISISASSINDYSKLINDEEVDSKTSHQINLSINSAKLIEEMDTDNKNRTSKMNKTTSIVEESNEFKSKRHRTKSWTTISVPPQNDGSFYSDSEVSKKKSKRGSNNFAMANNLGSGDGILNVNNQTNKENDDERKNISLNTSVKKKKRLSEKSLINDEPGQSVNTATSNESPKLEKIVTEIKMDSEEHEASTKKNSSAVEKLFEEPPSGVVQTLLYIEDSDSNTGSVGKANTDKLFDGGDQCVPVIEHQLQLETSKQPNNVSCEPMDIDETIPENTSIILLAEKDTSAKAEEQNQESKRKSSISLPNEDSINKTTNKSKRKSSIRNSESQNIDITNTENKSTLVLSQLKDISTNEETAETGMTKIVVDKNELVSKSFNVNESNKNKDVDKKNVSLNYSTSTPLQQKSLKKLGMQINTSIITPNNKNKKEEVVNKSKNNTAILSKSDDSDFENDSNGEDSEESSGENGKLFIHEAEEASDDYESGDSRDEEEKQYEEDHEIKEKGETLNSDDEEEYSDDSDYEKGSFIVSSDEEDDKLLSGSDEDLDMSADELSMSVKSKKKYNERQIKEQKRASREMFQARHKLDESDKITKPNKSKSKKANRLDSSESEEDVNVEKKINRRQRIDSSQDVSVDVEKSLTKKKKKTRRLSDSICEDDATSEKEITICQENILDKKDPLSVQNVIKVEPKTPLKSLDISTVEVTNMAEVEEIHVDENASMAKMNETCDDPLQATMLQNDDDDDSDVYSISENEEITQNYDSLLNNLNKSKSKQIKTLDMSLNINKKEKQKTKAPVIDQLNLTQTKKSKKNKNSKPVDLPEPEQIHESMHKTINKVDVHNEDSSDSIDMKLLFTEDSNDSEVLNTKIQNKDSKEITGKDDYTNEIAEDFIPLKRTEAKMNILEDIDLTLPEKSELNVSKKKNKKPKLSTDFSTSKDNNDVSFFIDTTGTHIEEIESNTLNKNSAKKTKNKRFSESVANIDDTITNPDKIELNVSLQNSSKKKKHKNASVLNTSEIKDVNFANEANNKYMDHSLIGNNKEIKDITDAIEIELAVPVKNSSKKNKNKKKGSSKIIDLEETNDIDRAANETSIVHSAKKKKNKNVSQVYSEEVEDDIELDTSTKSKTKKSKQHDCLDAIEADISINNSDKKNKKNSLSFTNAEEIKQDINLDEVEANVSITNSKKNKSNIMSLNTEENTDDAVTDRSVSGSEKKKKKNKKTLDASKTNIEAQEVDEIDAGLITDVSQKKKRISESQIAENTEETHDEDDKLQKRKRKLSANRSIEGTIKDDAKDSNTSKTLQESFTTGSQKKKLKVSVNSEVAQNEDPINEILEDVTVKKSKKKNKHKQNLNTDQTNENILPSMTKDVTIDLLNTEEQSESATKKINKKRKRKDEDDEGKSSKIIKQNSLDELHIPRLPTDVLKQLDDKPKQVEMKKAKIISTTPFLVEQTKKRKNKPSNYLEQSVYLNDTLEEKKQKGTIKTPKVLPFIPTASTSDSGFTTNFRINVIQEQPVFAQTNDVINFKNQYLHNKKIKKLGTFEKYKRQRNIKLSKF